MTGALGSPYGGCTATSSAEEKNSQKPDPPMMPIRPPVWSAGTVLSVMGDQGSGSPVLNCLRRGSATGAGARGLGRLFVRGLLGVRRRGAGVGRALGLGGRALTAGRRAVA